MSRQAVVMVINATIPTSVVNESPYLENFAFRGSSGLVGASQSPHVELTEALSKVSAEMIAVYASNPEALPGYEPEPLQAALIARAPLTVIVVDTPDELIIAEAVMSSFSDTEHLSVLRILPGEERYAVHNVFWEGHGYQPQQCIGHIAQVCEGVTRNDDVTRFNAEAASKGVIVHISVEGVVAELAYLIGAAPKYGA